MANLQTALNEVNTAVDETKRLTDSAFNDLTPSVETSSYSEESESEDL